MSTPSTPIVDQAGVNSAGSFDAAADSILGMDALGSEPQIAETAAADVAEPQSGAADTQAKPDVAAAGGAAEPSDKNVAAENIQADEWAIDQALLDKALADPTHGAIVKALQEKYQKALGWKEHWPTPEEAREARSLVPGGLQELKETVAAAQAAKAENAEFASADPVKQGAVLKNLATDMPEAFVAGAKPYLETLKATAPEKYNEMAVGMAREALEADGMVSALAALFAGAKSDDEKAFGEAFKQLSDWYGKAGFGATADKGTAASAAAPKLSPEIQKALDENKQYKEREQQQTVESFNTWKKGLDESFAKTTKEAISTKLDIIPKNMPTKMREALVNRVQSEIFAEIQKRLNADTDLGKKTLDVLNNRAWQTNGEKAREQVHNLWTARATQLLPFVAQEILNPLTEAQVASAAAKNDKEAAAGSRQDIRGNASAATAGRTAFTAKDMKGRGAGKQLSDEQLLDM